MEGRLFGAGRPSRFARSLAQVLRVSRPGHCGRHSKQPGWVIIRLEELSPAVLDQPLRRQLLFELVKADSGTCDPAQLQAAAPVEGHESVAAGVNGLARILRAQPGFDQLPDADFAGLGKAARPLRLRPGQKLFDYGALPPGLAIVATGLLRLLARDERRTHSPCSVVPWRDGGHSPWYAAPRALPLRLPASTGDSSAGFPGGTLQPCCSRLWPVLPEEFMPLPA